MRWLAASSAVGQLSLILVIPILTRLYSPSEVGLFQVALAISVITSALFTLRVEVFLPVFTPSDRALVGRRFAWFSMAAATTLSLFALTLMLYSRTEEIGKLVAAVAAMSGVAALMNIDSALLVGSGERHRLMARNALSGVFAAGLQVLGGLAFPSLLTLVAAIVLGRASAVLVTAKRSAYVKVPDGRPIFQIVDFRACLQASATSVISMANTNVLLFGALSIYGPQTSGHVAVAQRAATAPNLITANGISQDFSMKAAVLINDRRSGVWRLLKVTFLRLLPASLLAAVLVASLGVFGIGILLGPAWEKVGPLAVSLSIATALQVAVSPLAVAFALLNRQGVHLFLEAGKLVTLGLSVALCAVLDLDIVRTATVIGLLLFASYVVTMLALRRVARSWDQGAEDAFVPTTLNRDGLA